MARYVRRLGTRYGGSERRFPTTYTTTGDTTMSHTTHTPPAARRSRWAINGALFVVVAAASTVVIYNVRPSSPAVSVSTGCDDISGSVPSVYVNLRHFSGPRAEVVLYTAGDAWSNSYNPQISRGRGEYAIGGVPAGPVTVEVTDPGHKVITKRVDVASCPRP